MPSVSESRRRHHTLDQDDIDRRDDHVQELDFPCDLTEGEGESERTTPSSYCDSPFTASPQSLSYHYAALNSASTSSSTSLVTANSTYSYDDEVKVLGALEDRFPFLKEERKRTRKLLSPEQTRVLEAVLEKTVYPSTPLREAVARQLGIPPRKVQIWFQNKRQGRRRMPSSDASFATHTHLAGPERHRRGGRGSHLRMHTYDQPQRTHPDDGPSHSMHWISVPPQHHRQRVPPPPSFAVNAAAPTRPRAHSDLTHFSTPSSTMSAPAPDLALPRQYSFKHHQRDRHPSERGIESAFASVSLQAIPTSCEAMFASTPGQTLPLPKPQSGAHTAPPCMLPPWAPIASLRERPPALTFDEHSRKSSSDSVAWSAGSNSSSFSKDDWSSRSTPPSSSSSTSACFAERVTTSPLLSASSKLSVHHRRGDVRKTSLMDGLHLAPIQSTEHGTGEPKRGEVLPSISELIRP